MRNSSNKKRICRNGMKRMQHKLQTAGANLWIFQMAARIPMSRQQLLFTKLSLFVAVVHVFKRWNSFQKYLSVCKNGQGRYIIVGSTHHCFLVHTTFFRTNDKKESTKHIIKTLHFLLLLLLLVFNGSWSYDFCWDTFFRWKAFDRFIFCCAAQFQVVVLLCWHIFLCSTRFYQSHVINQKECMCSNHLMRIFYAGQKQWSPPPPPPPPLCPLHTHPLWTQKIAPVSLFVFVKTLTNVTHNRVLNAREIYIWYVDKQIRIKFKIVIIPTRFK